MRLCTYAPIVSRIACPGQLTAYLDCGRLFGGFARLRCPSCQAKRAALFAEKLECEIAAPVPHRHLVFTIPRALRGLFERDRKLLSLLPRCAYRAVRLLYQSHFARHDALPGMVASIQTFGAALNLHPHS